MWGKSKDLSEAPKFLPPEIRARAFLTNRGWEIQPHGNDNPASSEVIVAIAGNIGDGSTNDSPVAWEYDLGTISGVSGATLSPVYFEVIDQETINTDMSIITGATFPDGLGITFASTSDQAFVIDGTPTESATGTTGITFSDGTNDLFLTFNLDISAS